MNFDQESMGVRISMPIMRRDLNSDISEDYTLPDYYPEIRKLLFARPSPLLPAKFISGGRVDLSGVVDYTLVYISAEGKLCSAPLSAEYSLHQFFHFRPLFSCLLLTPQMVGKNSLKYLLQTTGHMVSCTSY